jgi:radical SAM superfamily enzyme YgiQ (UPF0313 family)
MKVLLINPPWERPESDARAKHKVISCLPSLGLGYIAAVLEQEGVAVKIVDLNVTREALGDLRGYLASLDFQPDYAGLTCAATTIKGAFHIGGIVKAAFKDCKIVIGGVQPTVMPEEALQEPCIGYAVRGEGEMTLLEMVRSPNPEGAAGLSYKADGKIIHNPDRAPIADLDQIPFPAYHLFPSMAKYHPPEGLFQRLPAINLITSRGCPYRCTYCATQTIWPGKLRFRSVNNVIGELQLLTDKYGIREISFSDDTLALKRERMVEMCERIINEKIDVTWSCNSIVKYIDADLLRLMKAAGCHHICYGVESANPQILKNIKKGITIEEAMEAIRLTKLAGITCRASFMFGNPGETAETIRETVDFAIRANPDFAVFNISTPYPGTPLYKWAKRENRLLSEDWEQYTGSIAHLRLDTIGREELERLFKWAWRAFYFRPGYILGRLKKIRSLYDLKAYMKGFFGFLLNR